MRQAVAGRRSGPLLQQVGVPGLSEQLLPAHHLRAEPVEQPFDAVRLVGCHDRAGVREGLQRGEPPTAEVEPVEVHVVRGRRGRDGPGDRPERRRTAGSRRPEDHQVGGAVEVEDQGRAALLGGHVEQAVRQGRHPTGGARQRVFDRWQVTAQHDVRQWLEPRGGLLRQPQAARGGCAGLDQQGQVRERFLSPVVVGHRARDGVAQLRRGKDVHGGRAGAGPGHRTSAADPSGLEGSEAGVSRAHVPPARRRAADRGGHRRVEDVARLAVAGHCQADPEVGVGPDVGGHDPFGALRRQDEVHPQRAAAHGDAHQAADEVWELLGQRGELVDDEHEAGQGCRGGRAVCTRSASHRPDQPAVLLHVLGAPGLQDRLPPAELGGQRGERPFDERPVEVGDEPDRVGQPGTRPEGGPALVVDQDERQLVRSVGQRERGEQGLQQLALARPGGPGHQGMGAVTGQVDGENAVVALPEHRTGRPPAGGGPAG